MIRKQWRILAGLVALGLLGCLLVFLGNRARREPIAELSLQDVSAIPVFYSDDRRYAAIVCDKSAQKIIGMGGIPNDKLGLRVVKLRKPAQSFIDVMQGKGVRDSFALDHPVKNLVFFAPKPKDNAEIVMVYEEEATDRGYAVYLKEGSRPRVYMYDLAHNKLYKVEILHPR